MSNVSIQGQPASYHDIARQKFFNNGEELVSRDTFKEVFKDVESGASEFGIAAIENSLYGSINQVYDLLLNTECKIIGEIYLRINHCLIGQNDAQVSDITSVYSQREAIAQCELWLEQNLGEADIHSTHDTAGSVEQIKASGDKSQAAIASRQAAELHGLKILEEGIETNHQNYTRFIVISKDDQPQENASKSSIVLTAANKPGSLYEALGIFNKHNVNLIKLESRPITGKPWEYMFYIDFEKGLDDEDTSNMLEELDVNDHSIHVLGSYPSGEMPKS